MKMYQACWCYTIFSFLIVCFQNGKDELSDPSCLPIDDHTFNDGLNNIMDLHPLHWPLNDIHCIYCNTFTSVELQRELDSVDQLIVVTDTMYLYVLRQMVIRTE